MEEKQIPLEGLIPGGARYEELQPLRLQQLQRWTSEGDDLLFFVRQEVAIVFSLSLAKPMAQIPLSDMTGWSEEQASFAAAAFHIVPTEPYRVWTQVGALIFFLDFRQGRVVRKLSLQSQWSGFNYSAEADAFAYTCGNGLFLLRSDGSSLLVEQSPDEGITAGQTAARDEFGIFSGTFWSPDGTVLAYYRIDERKVTQYPLVNIEDPISSLNMIRYPMAGQTSQEADLCLFHLKSAHKVTVAKQGARDAYLCCVTFSPDCQSVFAAELQRNQQQFSLNQFEVSSGAFLRTLFTESDEKYVEPQHPLFFIPDGSGRFVWQSRRDGYNHLYLYSADGQLLSQLTHGQWEVTALVGYDGSADRLLVQSTSWSPLCRDVLSVSLQGVVSRLSVEPAVHSPSCLSGGTYVDQFSSHLIPGEVKVCRLSDGAAQVSLLSAVNPLLEYSVPECRLGSLRLQNDELYYRLVLPPHFSDTAKYPMVCYFYGGPHVQLVVDNWNCGTAGFEYMMAQAGYVVFTIDPHGSDNRGRDFEQTVWRHIGQPQLADYCEAVKAVCRQCTFIDDSRIGVYGWSFGGFMATSLMLKAPELFKVGVAGGPVINWRYYEVMYTERYMQTPQQNEEGYDENDLCRFVGQLRGRLMLIHCNNDPVVLWQNSLQLLKASVKAGRQLDYNVYVGHPHNVRGPERVHLMTKVRRYFVETL